MRRFLAKINLDLILALACFVVSFTLYARTVSPGLLDDDGGEFQTNIYRLGVSHTGYPLFFILAKLWTLVVPLGDIAYRANLFSALFAALTVVLLYATMRTLVASRGAALITAMLLAVSRVEWSQSVIPRPYTLNSFFVVLVVLLVVLWRTGRISLGWVIFGFGLSLTNHRTMIWMGPALALIILSVERWSVFRPRRFLELTAAFILPLLFYLYIPLRGDSDVGVEYHTSNFKDMILAGNASIWLRYGPPKFLWDRFAAFYLPLQIEQFSLLGFTLGLIGIVALAAKRVPRGFPTSFPPRQFLLFMGLAFAFQTVFGIVFVTLDSEKYFLPSYLLFLMMVGLGLAFVFDKLSTLDFSIARRILPPALAAGLLALCVYLGVVNFHKVDASNDEATAARWEDIWSQPIETDALLIGNWESLTPLEYYQYVEQTRTDLQRFKAIIYQDQLKLAPQGSLTPMIQQALDKGQTVYLTLHPSQTETLGYLSQKFDLVPIASLWRVQRIRPDPPAATLDARFGDTLVLHSIALDPNASAGDFVRIVLNWRLDEPLDHNFKFSLRLKDADGGTWIQREITPLGGLKLTTAWQTGQPLRDEEGFFVPPDAPPGDYTLELAVYDADSHATLTVDGAPVQNLGSIHILSSANQLPREVYHIPHPLSWAANLHLLGYGVSDERPRGGDAVELDTWWEGLTTSADNLQIELQDASGARTTLYNGTLIENAAGVVVPKQIMQARHTLQLPPTAAAGRASLRLLVHGQTLELGPLDLRASDRQFTAPAIPHSQKATLGSGIELLGYNLDRRNDGLHVTLYWHATQAGQVSDKVFVHLLDPGGVLRAQQDSIPRGGSLPTDRWLAGEYITDEYLLTLPSNLVPGSYRVETGMYAPDTGVRLPVLDASGARLQDDRILLDTPVQIGQ